MVSECRKYLEWIPRSLAGDLSAQEQQHLDLHLAGCAPCREEQVHYAQTLEMLKTMEDEPVPRHFFVYPPERKTSPWQIFRQLMPRWQIATAGALALLVLFSLAAVSGLRIQSDRGAWAVSFGRAGSLGGVDVAALKADILNTAEERNRANAMAWIRDLRAELISRTDLTQQQQMQLVEALSGIETRLNGRMNATLDATRTGAEKANSELYQAVSLQRDQDLNRLNARLDNLAEANQTKFRQTDEILETLLQIVTNLKQPGEQK
jgi:hypothetical protein